jgi:acetyl-CoA C-acetyltransferase
MTRMSEIDPRTPCIIGVAQRTWRPGTPDVPEPLVMQEEVAHAAADDAGSPGLLQELDSLQVVYCQSWPYEDPVGLLAARLGADPKHRLYSGIGGTTPQQLVNDIAESILRGDTDLALVVGAEALYTLRQIKKTGERAAWSHRDPVKKPFPFEAMPHASEITHEVFQAYLTFALLDIARRADRGATPSDHLRAIGETLAPMSEVAATNPYAWFPSARSAEELVTPTADNRLVAYPYTKHSVAVMDVDMAAAVVVASAARADALGVPEDQRVYLRGWAYGTDAWFPAARAELGASPAMRAVSAVALAGAGLGVDDIGAFDLYSCFASSVHFACDALGLSPTDARGVTVTGGLPFAGGPASNYMLHSIAAMVARLRAAGGHGLVSGVGMHMTKHVYAVYSASPGRVTPPDSAALKAGLKTVADRTVVEGFSGEATIAAYSVLHARDAAAERGVLILDVDAGSRAYAVVRDAGLLAQLEAEECVGRSVRVVTDGAVSVAIGDPITSRNCISTDGA